MRVSRFIGTYTQENEGPLFVVLAGVHGNELAGIKALNRIFNFLDGSNAHFKGEFIGLAGNLPAIEQGKRFIDIDLNRQWHRDKIDWVRSTPNSQLKYSEDLEQKELIRLFNFVLRASDRTKKMVLLDLHTTSAEGGVFSIANKTELSLELAQNLQVPAIVGIEDVIKGTTLNYFTELGLTAFGFEAGQHDNPYSIDRMEAAIWLTLEKIGCLTKKDIPSYDHHFEILTQLGVGLPKSVKFLYRHPVTKEDYFEMKLGYRNFDKIKKGEVLAKDIKGDVTANQDGMILMPLYQKQGEDGFFIVE